MLKYSTVLALLMTGVHVESFAPHHTNVLTAHFETALDAKAKTKKKKQKATTTRTGGFGTVVEKKSSKKIVGDDDYAAFPALQQQVKDTLIPSTTEDQENAKDLPSDLYNRLEQIYGFKDFNFPTGWFDDESDQKEEREETESLSFDELLSGGKTNTQSSSVGNDFGDLLKPKDDISTLIASATGGPIEGVGVSSKKVAKVLPIENLPPFNKFRVLHVDPMVLAIDDFFTDEECDEYVNKCANPKKQTSSNDMPMKRPSGTVGKDSLAKAQRTSTTWYHHFKSVPELMAKASRLLGLRSIDRWEEPQTVRYQPEEKFTWHLDAMKPEDDMNEVGGQRVATLLVYLTELGPESGGSTLFRDLGRTEDKYLTVKPKKGSALLFFPAAGGIPDTPFDIRTLHAGEVLAADSPKEKWIAQMWLRENNTYTPSAPPGNSYAMANDAIEEYCAKI